jgi:hypothetical protein
MQSRMMAARMASSIDAARTGTSCFRGRPISPRHPKKMFLKKKMIHENGVVGTFF